MKGSITVCAVGDVFVEREQPASMFTAVAPLFEGGDIKFGNCEGAYTRTPARPPSAAHMVVSGPANITGLSEVGFDVMACANNHFVDGGHSAMLETLDRLKALGIATVGAGADLSGAHRPARLERNGVAVEVLAYTCVHPAGYEARMGVPGLATLRVLTHYWADPLFWNPGMQPEIATFATQSALETLRTDVGAARSRADVVMVSFHWGDSSRPVKLQDYEMQLGRAAVDAGADVVLGHHHHCLRGVELYLGKPILYGLGSFAFDLRDIEKRFSQDALRKMRERNGDYAFGLREGYPSFPFHPEYRQTVLARIVLVPKQEPEVTLVPCMVRPAGHPEPLPRGSAEAARWAEYMSKITVAEGFTTQYEPSSVANYAQHAALRVGRAGA